MTPGYVNGVRITHRRGERGTRLDRPVPSYRQDIDRPHDIPWGHYPASAPIHAPACAPPPAHGAGLRRIRFVDLKGAARLVIELPDDPRIARLADGLRLARRHVLRGVVEGLPDIAGGTREGVGHLARRFVHEIGEAPPGGPALPARQGR